MAVFYQITFKNKLNRCNVTFTIVRDRSEQSRINITMKKKKNYTLTIVPCRSVRDADGLFTIIEPGFAGRNNG
jgi:hypothetical protein